MSRLGGGTNNFTFSVETASSSSSSGFGDGQLEPYPALELELLRVRWYHPNLNRHAAEHILLGTDKVGSYLMRTYSRGGPDDLTVSVKYPEDVKHFPVLWQGDGYLFGKHKFDNLRKLLEHFENIPAIGTADLASTSGGYQVELRYPYPREVHTDDKETYMQIEEHIETGARPVDIHSPTGQLRTSDPDFEIRKKSGYLTKRGDNVKNWKSRWFVIQKHWLRYYVSNEATNPRGVIDLSKALDCNEDDSFSNGFTITVRKRIYYIQAATPEDRKAWVEMICWKLDYYNPCRSEVEKPKPLTSPKGR
ncbi:dual adapter for phosphotyrosine and 3-phosphotyrosine and 3-phosphoinositide-like [Bolinopsis microptera]|uniref:dual adapter for phosphotyrosine and 3-phosphotyrosine and 3-phosphoinositide-like n=1 Tax=Bolinopsis microptera TaxID=2820187 RepID=UPI003078D145